MSTEAYELLSMLMRYVFIVLGALIVLRSYRWLRRDTSAYNKEMKNLPDAGLVGEVVDLTTGKAYPLPHEGVIGSSRACDITLKGHGIARRHATFSFVPGKGLAIKPLGGNMFYIADMQMNSLAYALHGTQLDIGDKPLRVRLFAGLNVPHPAQYSPYEEAPYTEQDAETDAYYGLMGDDDAPPFQPPQAAYNAPEDAQMTWPYAPYPPQELDAMAQQFDDPEDAPPPFPDTFSPQPRVRRGRRHGQ